MAKMLHRDTFREIRRTLSRFLSILVIVALGVGFFSGIKSTGPDMKLTGDGYYRDRNLMDLRLVSTMGFTDDDVRAIEKVQGVGAVEPSYTVDAILSQDESRPVVRLIAMEQDWRNNPEGDMNRPVLKEGRMPQAENECLAENGSLFSSMAAVTLGQEVTLTSDDGKSPLTDTLGRDTYTIVGLVESPLYISYQHGSSSIGNGSVSTFLMIPPENFKTEVYTQLYVTAAKEETLSAFDERYTQLVEDLKTALGPVRDARIEARYDEVIGEAQSALEDARIQLRDGEETQRRELEDAQRELEDAKAKLDEGQRALDTGKSELQSQRDEGTRQLDAARAQMDQSKKDYNEKRSQFDLALPDAQKKLEDTARQLGESQTLLDANRAKLTQGQTALTQLRKKLDSGWADYNRANVELAKFADLIAGVRGAMAAPLGVSAQQLENLAQGLIAAAYPQAAQDLRTVVRAAQAGTPDAAAGLRLAQAVRDMDARLTQQRAQQAEVFTALEQGEGEYNTQLISLKKSQQELDAGQARLDAGKAQLVKSQKELADTKALLDTAAAQISSGERELTQKQALMDTQLADAQAKLSTAEHQLSQGRADYTAGLAEFEQGKADSDRELADARARIQEGEEQQRALEKPTWYLFTRADNPGYTGFGDDADRIDSIASVFPVFFILVAGLVCLTTMTRMVEEQRTQVGTLKALGYSKSAIVMKFLTYSTLASVVGSALGLVVCMKLFPWVIFNAYRIMYHMPTVQTPFHWDYALICTLVAVLGTGAAALAACYSETMAQPSQLMRPRAPKAGKRVLLERVGFIWKRLKFTQKVTVRNLFRYKRKIFMTVLGIAGCTALMLVGFGLKDSLSDIVGRQFSKVFLYDVAVQLDEEIPAAEIGQAVKPLRDVSGVEKALPLYSQKFTTVGKTRQDITLYVPEKPQELGDYIHLHHRGDGQPVPLTEDGAVVTEKIASMLGLGVGDSITVRDADNREITIPITGIAENYASHFLYLTPQGYAKFFGSSPSYTTVLTALSGDADETEVTGELLRQEHVLGASGNSTLTRDFNDMIGTLNYVVLVLIISASALAFVVLYNLSNVNVNERIREIATIKVLGFYDGEVTQYIFRENVLLTLMGIVFGLVGGIFLHQFVIVTAEIDTVMFGRQIKPLSYVLAAVLTFAFSMIVNGALHFRLKKVSMVESLKSIE